MCFREICCCRMISWNKYFFLVAFSGDTEHSKDSWLCSNKFPMELNNFLVCDTEHWVLWIRLLFNGTIWYTFFCLPLFSRRKFSLFLHDQVTETEFRTLLIGINNHILFILKFLLQRRMLLRKYLKSIFTIFSYSLPPVKNIFLLSHVNAKRFTFALKWKILLVLTGSQHCEYRETPKKIFSTFTTISVSRLFKILSWFAFYNIQIFVEWNWFFFSQLYNKLGYSVGSVHPRALRFHSQKIKVFSSFFLSFTSIIPQYQKLYVRETLTRVAVLCVQIYAFSPRRTFGKQHKAANAYVVN